MNNVSELLAAGLAAVRDARVAVDGFDEAEGNGDLDEIARLEKVCRRRINEMREVADHLGKMGADKQLGTLFDAVSKFFLPELKHI
jgi:hypothetical protein